MRHVGRLAVYEHFGVPDPVAFSLDLSAATSYRQALKNQSGLTNCVVLRADKNGKSTGDVPAIILKPSLIFPQTLNEKAAWTQLSGGVANYELFQEAGRAGRLAASTQQALAYTKHASAQAGSFRNSTLIGLNQGFALRLYIPEPPKGQSNHIWMAAWDSWGFRIRSGSTEIIPPNSTEWISLSLGETSDSIYDNWFTVWFLPEPRGAVNVFLEGAGMDTVDVPHVLSTREVGTVWGASALTLSSNGGGFVWQAGYPWFAASGVLNFTDRLQEPLGGLGALSMSVQADTSLSGTNVEINKVNYGETLYEIQVALSTNNYRHTPFLYSAQANLAAGLRTGEMNEVWDSDDHKNNGVTIMEEAQLSCEGEMRRMRYDVTWLIPNGQALVGITGDQRYEGLENRVATYSIDGHTCINGGLITASTQTEMKDATENLVRAYVSKPQTRLMTSISDAWAVFDEDEMTDFPEGDGKRLGFYLRQIIMNAGLTTTDVYNIDPNAGRILPRAAFGEKACVRPAEGITRGDYLRSLVDKWGMGLILYQQPSTGRWALEMPGQSITTNALNSNQPFAFHNMANGGNSPTTYPGRYCILEPLDFERDFSDFYNMFRVEGNADVLGYKYAAEYIDWASINRGGGPGSKTFIGRRKKFQTVQDDGLRTVDDVQWVLASLRRRYNMPGRFLPFTTYFHPALYAGATITVSGVWCQLRRLSGSVKDDRSQLVAQELKV
jgi:hypothetical protein